MRLLIILTFSTILWSCEKQRKQVEKFVFDSKQISMKDIHRYEFYPNGKIKTDTDFFYLFRGGIPYGSTISKEYYQYNSKGKILSITNLTDSTNRLKSYNDQDSLIADTQINKYGDTTFLALKDYENGKMIKRSERLLFENFSKNLDNQKKVNLKNYDTLLIKTEFIYEGDHKTKFLSIDKKGKVTEETEFFYEGGRQTKSITYSFLGEVKYIKQTTYYSTKDPKNEDYVTIGMQGDTIALQETIFQDSIKIVINGREKSNIQHFEYYNKKEQLIGTIKEDIKNKLKIVYSYKYDNKGNVIEEANYRERMNNAR